MKCYLQKTDVSRCDTVIYFFFLLLIGLFHRDMLLSCAAFPLLHSAGKSDNSRCRVATLSLSQIRVHEIVRVRSKETARLTKHCTYIMKCMGLRTQYDACNRNNTQGNIFTRKLLAKVTSLCRTLSKYYQMSANRYRTRQWTERLSHFFYAFRNGSKSRDRVIAIFM